jgi:hypothetical protein
MAAIYDKALKRREFWGVVSKGEKGKGKDKTTTDDNGKRTRVYPSVLYVWGSADGKSRQD